MLMQVAVRNMSPIPIQPSWVGGFSFVIGGVLRSALKSANTTRRIYNIKCLCAVSICARPAMICIHTLIHTIRFENVQITHTFDLMDAKSPQSTHTLDQSPADAQHRWEFSGHLNNTLLTRGNVCKIDNAEIT